MRLIKNEKGFTLIELLIVIVIIGILAAAVIAVIDPAKQQQKAKEATMKANLDKACLALFACANTTTSALSCDGRTEMGVRTGLDGSPVGSTYNIKANATGAFDWTVAADETAGAATDAISFVGNVGTCTWGCGFDFGTTDSTLQIQNLLQRSAAGTCL